MLLLTEWSQHSQEWINGSPMAVIFTSDTFSKASTVPPILLQIHLFHFSSAFWNVLWWMSVLCKLVIRSSCSYSYIKLNPSVSGLFKVWVSHCQETWLHQSSIWVLFAKNKRTNLNEECLDGLWDTPVASSAELWFTLLRQEQSGYKQHFCTDMQRVVQMWTEMRSWLAVSFGELMWAGCCLVFSPDPLTSSPVL